VLSVDLTQRYRSVSDVRSALAAQRSRLLPEPNGRAVMIRRSLGLSRAEMAARHGVSRSFWKQMELGQKRVPAAILRALQVAP
jgi:DNA-binding transcriptional regulator YiaG